MENENLSSPILKIAWIRYTMLDRAASRRILNFYTIRRGITLLSTLTILFAILTVFFSFGIPTVIGLVINILFIACTSFFLILTAYAKLEATGWEGPVLRAGAEEILKEIYLYRTIRKNNPRRYHILRQKLAKIQGQLSRLLVGELSFEIHEGPVPPTYNPSDPGSDPGFNDLDGDQYSKFRLERMLAWYSKRVNNFKLERRRMTLYILLTSIVTVILATWGEGELRIWAAFTASITAAFVSWYDLFDRNSATRNYSKVLMDLTLLYDYWQNLEPEERTEQKFHNLVVECEKVLWAQNLEYVRLIQEVSLEKQYDDEANPIEDLANISVTPADTVN